MINTKEKKFSIRELTHEDAQETLEYWTPAKKAKAVPISMAIEKNPYKKMEENISHNISDEMLNNDNLKLKNETAFEVDVNQHPYDCGGKLFIVYYTEDGQPMDLVGSAQFVGHCQIVLTAAHCVRDWRTGKYFEKILFTRGYIRGELEQEAGQDFTFTRVGTPDKFVSDQWRGFDYAFALTNEPYNWYLGLQAGIPYNELQAIGYPSNFDKGRKMFAVNGIKGRVSSNLNIVEMKENVFSPGASGGAWLANYNEGVNNIAVGVNSTVNEKENYWTSPLFRNRDIFDLFYQIQQDVRC